LLFYYQPFKNLENIEDIDGDGLSFDKDPYPLNYSNGEIYMILVDSEKADLPEESRGNIIYTLKDTLEDNLNYGAENIYLLDSVSIEQFTSTIQEVLSKTTEKDIIFLSMNSHGSSSGKLVFYDEDGSKECYYVSGLNGLFKDEKYSSLFITLGNCYGYAVQNILTIEKTVSIAESKGEAPAFALFALNEQIQRYNLNFNDFMKHLENNWSISKPRIQVDGKPNLPEDQEDWLILPANYKNPNYK